MELNQEGILMSLDEKLFEVFWANYGANIKLNKDFIKKVFLSVDLKYKEVIADSSVSAAMLKNVGTFDMINYILAEHQFHLSILKPELKDSIESDEKYFNQLVNICYDKLVTNEFIDTQSRTVISKFSVETSVLMMYINRMFLLLSSLQISKENVKGKLLIDIYGKCFMLIKSTINQLCDGLETEAMSSWRTFHELLSVLRVINKGDEEVAKAYYRHLTYGAYSRNEIKDPKVIESIEASMEKDMEALAVKKANKEKFINYGWIHWVYKVYNGEEVKMNFLGGLEKVADLTQFKKYYELSSDVTHSTPLLVYANKKNLTTTTLKITYEQFFIIETMFISFIENDLKIKAEDNKKLKEYLQFRQTYKNKIEIIYSMINQKYSLLN